MKIDLTEMKTQSSELSSCKVKDLSDRKKIKRALISTPTAYRIVAVCFLSNYIIIIIRRRRIVKEKEGGGGGAKLIFCACFFPNM